jgi:hypothetical protein
MYSYGLKCSLCFGTLDHMKMLSDIMLSCYYIQVETVAESWLPQLCGIECALFL